MSAMPVTLIEFKPIIRNTLRGFATIRLGKSLTIFDVALHTKAGKCWAQLPSKPIVDRDGRGKLNDAGKLIYTPVMEWADKAAGARFSEAVVAAIRAEHPDAFGT